MLDQTFGPTSI